MIPRVPNRQSVGRTLRALLAGGALAVFGSSGFVGTASAQDPPTPRGYRIIVGDVLQVDVVGRADMSGQFLVEKDGAIAVPVLGSVTAAGRTTTELGTDISRRVSLISRDIPQVTVSVLQSFRRKNFVLGAVLLPGSYSFARPPTVWEAISEAGGPADDANMSAVQIISEAQITPTVVDLATAMQRDDLGSLPLLRPGDTVRVPRRILERGAVGDVVYVFGAVSTQGSQPLSEASDLVRAVIRSGPGGDADFTNVEIVRKSGARVVSMKVNLDDYLGKAAVVGNPGLQSGDTVYLRRKTPELGFLRVLGIALGIATSVAILTNNTN